MPLDDLERVNTRSDPPPDIGGFSTPHGGACLLFAFIHLKLLALFGRFVGGVIASDVFIMDWRCKKSKRVSHGGAVFPAPITT